MTNDLKDKYLFLLLEVVHDRQLLLEEMKVCQVCNLDNLLLGRNPHLQMIRGIGIEMDHRHLVGEDILEMDIQIEGWGMDVVLLLEEDDLLHLVTEDMINDHRIEIEEGDLEGILTEEDHRQEAIHFLFLQMTMIIEDHILLGEGILIPEDRHLREEWSMIAEWMIDMMAEAHRRQKGVWMIY